MADSLKANRGPGAAAENRAALISAARTIFATHGVTAPLNAIAKHAGVGQGSLYRHFPTRYALAIAVFQENLGWLERVAATPESTLGDVLTALTEQAILSTAIFEMLEIERTDASGQELSDRIRALVSSKMDGARRDGSIADGMSTDDVLLGVAMLTGALSKVPLPERRAVAVRIWSLLPFGPTELPTER
jgi:AcrR family transcriptional regulator